ncbi:WASH complex subunit 3 isoform X3 [Monodelphis domestica]|uniref:WASH complex subunit 3 isoform X3 n=1 Tax=Monodelphis domestica TaxID=13616 RepID=UPI0004431110|nr:WASH complex subunit 3 isoform X3 [Monodelphis domestica]
MDEDGLPLMGSGIDLTKVPAIQQKRTVAFLNQFVVHTVQFLNRFSTVCEEKLSALSLRIQQIETTLNILDAKLSSIPGLEDVKFEISTANVNSVTNGPEATPDQQSSLSPQSEQNNTQDSGPQKCEAAAEHILTVAKDPRYARYLKMVQVVWQKRINCPSKAAGLEEGPLNNVSLGLAGLQYSVLVRVNIKKDITKSCKKALISTFL